MLVDVMELSLGFAKNNVNAVMRLAPGWARSIGQAVKLCSADRGSGSYNVLTEQLSNAVLKKNWEKVFSLAKGFFESLPHTDSDLETEWDDGKKRMLVGVTVTLSKVSYDMAEAYKQILCKREAEKNALIEKKNAIFEKIGDEKKQVQEIIAHRNEAEAACIQLKEDIDNQVAETLRARQTLDGINAKIRKLNKWCWVPGYNVYLLVEAEKASSHWDGCAQRLENTKRRIDKLERERRGYEHEITTLLHLEEEEQKQIDENERKLQLCIEEINTAKRNVLQYSDIAVFFCSENERLRYSDDDIQMLSDIAKNVCDIFDRFPGLGAMVL